MGALHLLTGNDERLLGSAVSDLVGHLVGDGDRGLMVEQLDSDDYEIATLVDAAQSPPFLTDKRVVVGRNVGRFAADDVKALVGYLSDPLASTDLVLVGGGGRLAKSLVDAVKKAGGLIADSDVSTNKRERGAWLDEHLAASGLKLDGSARARLADHLGEDFGRLRSILETLTSSYGLGAKLSAEQVMPFLGDAGSVPPWDLTDAIDRGDTPVAMAMLARMMQGGERHPLQVMAILHGHYVRVLRLDGAGVTDETSAAQLLGARSTFQAKKALDQSRRIGHVGVVRAFNLLSQADLDIRGAKDWPEALVMEVLVARLSKLVGSSRNRR